MNSYSSAKALVPTSPKPKGLEADSNQVGLWMEATMVESSLQCPVHHEEDSVLWWRGINYRLSRLHPDWAWMSDLGCILIGTSWVRDRIK